MAENVLQSFVIKLKYLVDDASAKKFQDNIKGGVQHLNAFRLAVVAAAVSVEEFVRRTTSNMSQLGGLARETNTAATAIERLRARFIGAHMSAQQADAALRSFMDTMRKPGQHSRAVGIIHQQFTDFDDFMQKAGARYNQLLKQYGNENDPNVVAYRNQLEAMQGGLSDNVRAIANFWDRQNRFANEATDIYRRFGYEGEKGLKQVTDASDDAEESFRRIGKTLEVSVIKMLTHTDDKGHSVLQSITNIANKFADWMASDDAQQKFTAFLDRVDALLPSIEWALSHIDTIVEGLLILMGVKLGGQVVGALTDIGKAALWLGGLIAGISTAAGGAAEALAAIGGTAVMSALGTVAAGLASLGGGIAVGALIDKYITGDAMDAVLEWIFGPPAGAANVELSDKAKARIDPKTGKPYGAPPAGAPTKPNISEGIQSTFSGEGVIGSVNHLLLAFTSWVAGDPSNHPIVELGEQTLERMGFGKAAGGGGGGASADGGDKGGGSSGGGTTSTPTTSGDGGGTTSTGVTKGGLSEAALKAIAKGEGTLDKSGNIKYNIDYGGKALDLEHMTLQQVADYQQKQLDAAHAAGKTGHSPVGAFQITKATLLDQAKALHLDLQKTMMTPEVQAQMATHLYQTRGLQPWSNPDTRSGATQRAFAQLKTSGGLFATETPTISAPSSGGAPSGGGSFAGSGSYHDVVDRALQMNGMTVAKDRTAIMNYLRAGGDKLDPHLSAWCAGFVTSTMRQAGLKTPAASDTAASWRNWGRQVSEKEAIELAKKGNPVVGISAPSMGASGHATLITGGDSRGAESYGRQGGWGGRPDQVGYRYRHDMMFRVATEKEGWNAQQAQVVKQQAQTNATQAQTNAQHATTNAKQATEGSVGGEKGQTPTTPTTGGSSLHEMSEAERIRRGGPSDKEKKEIEEKYSKYFEGITDHDSPLERLKRASHQIVDAMSNKVKQLSNHNEIPAWMAATRQLTTMSVKLSKQMETTESKMRTSHLGSTANSDKKVNINSDHKVTINVHGGDSHAVARQIEQTQSRTAATHLRNMRTMVA